MENEKSPTHSAAGRILIVDDHPNMATTLARAMTQIGSGFDIITAESGEMALELVRDKSVDLVITDLVMPGMTGLELIEKLQAHPGGRPSYTALVTAYDVPGLKETARRLKVNDVINKPVRPERICQIVAKAIEDLGGAPIAPEAVEEKPQLKILVADDLPDNISLLSRYLQNEGYLCISAANGVEALAKIRAELPDLILLDVNMPVKDGFETLQEIRSDPSISHIPVIILTAAKLEPIDMQYALNIGADDYVTKPFDRRELLARIRSRLRVKESEDIIRRQNKQLSLLPEIGRELSARLDVGELVDLILRRTVETLGALSGHIILQTPQGTQQKSYRVSQSANSSEYSHLPSLSELLARIQKTRQGFIIDDTRKDPLWGSDPKDPARAAMVVPMFGRLDMLGMLILTHEQCRYFNLDQKLLLQAIAGQAAIALENAQLHASMIGRPIKPISATSKPILAAILFDAEGRLSWLSPDGEKLFANRSTEIGEKLRPGKGFDSFIALLEDASKTKGPQTREINWPDGRIFSFSLNPMEKGGFLALVFALREPEPQPVKASNTVMF